MNTMIFIILPVDLTFIKTELVLHSVASKQILRIFFFVVCQSIKNLYSVRVYLAGRPLLCRKVT